MKVLSFKIWQWLVVVRRIRTITREELDQAGVIVCGDVEAQMLADSEREMHEYEVMSDLYTRVDTEVDGVIEACHVVRSDTASEAARRQALKNVTEFLRDIRDLAWAMDPTPPSGQEP